MSIDLTGLTKLAGNQSVTNDTSNDGEGFLAGLGGGLSDLFKNKLFLQMLSGAGANLAGKNSMAAGLNQVVQQNISAQNFAKMLGGVMNKGGKMTLDKDKFNLTGPTNALQGGDAPNAPGGSDSPNSPSNTTGGNVLSNPFQQVR